MKQVTSIAATGWLVVGLAGAAAASAATSEAPRHARQGHDGLAAKVAKAPHAKAADLKALHAKAPRVSEASARRIAWRSGVDHIEEIVLTGEHWQVAGRDRTGNEKVLDIHAGDGSILD